MEIKIVTYGGIITSWSAPDKHGEYEDVVLDFESLKEYLKDNPHFLELSLAGMVTGLFSRFS